MLEYRGEIVTVPAKKGDPRNLTETPGVHERSPVWSPDGKSIAYFSDASGEYALHVRPQDGKGEPRVLCRSRGPGFYERPVWSPDSKKIAFIDNARTLSWIDLATGAVKRVAAEPVYSPIKTLSASWSPDSNWLAYTLTNKVGFQTIWLYSLDQDKSHPLTDGLAEAGEPVFDAGGKYLYFLASTDAGPVKNWFDQSFTDMPADALGSTWSRSRRRRPTRCSRRATRKPRRDGQGEGRAKDEERRRSQKEPRTKKSQEPTSPDADKAARTRRTTPRSKRSSPSSSTWTGSPSGSSPCPSSRA